MKVKIKENSAFAKMAALNFKNKATAITIGKTIHLYKVNKSDFLKDKKWLRHELEHVLQFEKYGFVPFLLLYAFELMKHGYSDNKWEVAARNSEKDLAFLDEFDEGHWL